MPVTVLGGIEHQINLKDGGRFYRHRLTNLNQEYADEQFRANFPLLRSMAMRWRIRLRAGDGFEREKLPLKWKIYADNAPPKEGRTGLQEIEVADLRKTGVQS